MPTLKFVDKQCRSCPKCHSEERSDEESVGGAGSAQIIPTTPGPFATLMVTWMQSFWDKTNNVKKGIAEL